MEDYVWDERYSLGIEEIDAQHRGLFDLLDRLHEIIGRNGAVEEMKPVVMDLVRYADEHFKAEERVMIETGYPDLLAHREEHLKFMREVSAAVGDLVNRRISLSLKLSKFLRIWISDHILKVDGRLAPFLKSRGLT